MNTKEFEAALKELGITQTALAEQLGVRTATPTDWKTSGEFPKYLALALDGLRYRQHQEHTMITTALTAAGFTDHQDDRQGSNVYWHETGLSGVAIDLDDHNESTGSFTALDSEGMPSGTHDDIEDAIRHAVRLMAEEE